MKTELTMTYLLILLYMFLIVAGEQPSSRERRQATATSNICTVKEENPCKGIGICKRIGQTYRCICHSNLYEGEKCSEKKQHCTPSKCLNGGTCEESQGTFICNCPKSYEGVQCEKDAKSQQSRARGHFLWYESDIYEAKNYTYLILMKEIGANLRYEFSSGDGFSFTATEITFDRYPNAQAFAKKNNVFSQVIPAEPRNIILFHYVYRKPGAYKIGIEIFNNDSPVMKTELPVVVFKIQNKCVPQIVTLNGCGSTRSSEIAYFRASKILVSSRITAACPGTTFQYVWTLYKRVPRVPFPEVRSYLHGEKTDFTSALFDPFSLPALSFILSCTVIEIDKKNKEKTHSNTALCWFRVAHRPPSAILVGGNQRTVNWAKPFTIDGSTSVDMDTNPMSRHSLVWTYKWTCWNSKNPEVSESFCKGKGATLPYKVSKITVREMALSVNEKYIFGLIASVGGKDSKLVEQEINAVETKPLELELRCKKNCDSHVLPLMSVIYEVACYSCEGQIVSYMWDMSPGSSNKKQNMDWEKDTEQGRNSQLLIISANSLLPGDTYTFQLKANSSYLNQEGSGAVNLRVHSDLVGGTCSISPKDGTSMITVFTVNCEGFKDNAEESDAALLYQFFQKSFKDDEEELLCLLDHDTEPIGDKMILMPGDSKKNYTSTIVIKVSNHIGMSVFYNLSVKVEPLSDSHQDLENLEEYISMLTSNAEHSIRDLIATGNTQGAIQYTTALTEVMSGIRDANAEQRTTDIRTKLRGNLLEILTEFKLDSTSAVKQVSTALHKVASLWEGEKPEKSPVLGKEMFNVSSEMAKQAGSLILKISNVLSNEAMSQEDFYSSGDFKRIARHLMAAGESLVLQNHTDKLYRVDDEWEESSDESTPRSRFMKEKNEDYPNYKEIDIYYQDNLENFRWASYWFFEGLKNIGNSISSDLYVEEKIVELNNKKSFFYTKKFRAADLNGQKFGSTSGYSGIKISREYAESIQSGPEEVFGLEVAIIPSNPIWWIQASPHVPAVNTEVVYVNLRDFDAKEDIKSGIMKGIEVYLALHSYERKVVEASGSSMATQIGDHKDEDDINVHQIQIPDGASIILCFEPPQRQEDKLMVVIFKHHRPTKEDFSGDAVMTLPHKNSNLDKNDSFSMFVRGSYNEEDPGFPQFFYLAVMPHPDNGNPSTEFAFKFSAHNILCNHYIVETGKWLSGGCEVGQESTFNGVHCACSHLSIFGAAFSVAPNRVDPFSDVKLFLKVVENPVSVALVCTILCLYAILLIFARRKDLKDKRKRAVIFLDDNVPGDSYLYLLTVYTGLGKKCGTSANVSLRLQGTEGISRIHILSCNERKVVQSGGEDWFLLLCPHSLGELLNIRIWHDNSGKSPNWYCKRVIVRELREMQVKGVWIFPVDRWLTVDGMPLAGTYTGTMPCCKVGVATPVELRKWKSIFKDTALLGFSDKHLWLSIFSRPVQSTFTSCQRLSIATNLLMSAMLVSIMFYGVAKAKPGHQLDVGGFRISSREWLVALQCMIITTILNIPIALLFRHSDSSDFKVYEILSRRVHHINKEKDQVKRESNIESSMVEKSNEPKAEIKEGPKNFQEEEFPNDSHVMNESGKATPSCFDDDFKLPNWCRLIGWFLCIFSILLSAYFVCLYGLSYGRIKSLLWLSAVLLAVFKKSLLVQPVKILFLSIFQSYAKTLTGPGEDDLKKNPLANDVQRKELERNLGRPKLHSQQSVPVKGSTRRHLLLKSNRPLSRNEVKAYATKEIKWRETCSRAFDVLALVFYVIALHIITYGTSDPLAWHNANVLEKILLSGHNNLEESRPELHNIVGHNDLFDYLNRTALPAVHATEGYGDITFDADEGWTAHLPSKLLGIPRLRQWRTIPVPCKVPLHFQKLVENETCLPQSSEIPVDQCSYGIRWGTPTLRNPNDRLDNIWHCYDPDEIGAFPVMGALDHYNGDGYSSDLGRNLKNSRRTFQFLKDSGWIDRYTRALILEFSMYNVDRNLFTIGHILFERSRLGTFVTSHQILTARLVEILFGQKIWGAVSYFIFIVATLVLLWRQCRRLYLSRVVRNSRNLKSEIYVTPDVSAMAKWKRILIIVFLPTPKGASKWSQLKGVFEGSRPEVSSSTLEEDVELKGLLSKQKSPPAINPELMLSTPVYPRYPLSPPSYIEWLLIVMSIVILFIYLMRNNAMHGPLERLDQGAISSERHKFVSLQLGVNWDYAFKYALAFDICLATSALWCTLPSFRRLPEKTLMRMSQGPLPTMLVCFGITLLAFGCSSHTSSLLGSATQDFSTVSQSLSTLLGWALGVEASEEVLGVGFFGKMLYCTFGIGCTVYIINLFITIVMEEFEKTHRQMKILDSEAEKEFGILEFFKEFWRRKRPSFKTCRKMFRRKKRGTHPEKSGEINKLGVSAASKDGEGRQRALPSEKEESEGATSEEGKHRSDVALESSEEDDLNVSGDHRGHFTLDDYLRLRAGGQISSKVRDDRWDEIINPKTSGNELKIKKVHGGARKLSISWLRRSKEEGNSSKLAWISLEGDGKELGEEDLNDRMKAMAAITVVLSQKGIRAKR